MAITKPYTFQAGTKARASEVNQDFDILYSEVNRLGTEILNIGVDIQDVSDGKANVNGNATQRFQLANPENSYDGVNKGYLEKSIANIKDYISGYIITKDTDNSIIVSPGSCYDSTFTTVLNTTGNITKENINQGAGLTYYVYVIGDSTGAQTDILLSSKSVNPDTPSGYSLHRLLGSFITDEDSKISEIIYYGNDPFKNNNIESILNLIALDYANGISISSVPTTSKTYKAPDNGAYIATTFRNSGTVTLYINGVSTPYITRDTAQGGSYNNMYVPLKKGDTIGWNSGLDYHVARFYRYRK